MTWGEIQIISLNKMFAKDEIIDIEDIEDLKEDSDCEIYLNSMPAVCNEAIQRLKPYVKKMYEWDSVNERYNKTTLTKITSDTASTYVLDLPEDACVLIPLYIASQLYKDDDISQATAYRNEFEIGLNNLLMNIENEESIIEVY